MSRFRLRALARLRGLAGTLAVLTAVIGLCGRPPVSRAQGGPRLPAAKPGDPAAKPGEPAPRAGDPAARAGETLDERARRESDLKAVEEAMSANAESRKRLEAEIAVLKTDRARLNGSLIETAEKLRATEDRIRSLEQRLDGLQNNEGAIRRSLDARRSVIVEVLAALQRMGRRPPPAVLVRPEDMLESVRTSMLLGAVLPELRAETEALATDLAELVALKRIIASDRETLRRELAGLASDQNRLDALVAARQGQLADAEKAFSGQREKATELASQARTLMELIDRMEREGAPRGSEDARSTADARSTLESRGAPEAGTRERFAALALRDPARLSPKIPFADARGASPRPVSGEEVRAFGASDGYGGTTRGISITTRPKAVVVSPADGWVAFAGPFRSFGRLLIINAGGGYYILLAGMDHVSVNVGQFVLAGEPVATMGETSPLSIATGAVETSDPVLYVEFRKDGGSIDPGPWWAKSQSEKVRG